MGFSFKRKILIALLAFGTVAGYGAGIRSVVRHHRAGWHHGAGGSWGCHDRAARRARRPPPPEAPRAERVVPTSVE